MEASLNGNEIIPNKTLPNELLLYIVDIAVDNDIQGAIWGLAMSSWVVHEYIKKHKDYIAEKRMHTSSTFRTLQNRGLKITKEGLSNGLLHGDKTILLTNLQMRGERRMAATITEKYKFGELTHLVVQDITDGWPSVIECEFSDDTNIIYIGRLGDVWDYITTFTVQVICDRLTRNIDDAEWKLEVDHIYDILFEVAMNNRTPPLK